MVKHVAAEQTLAHANQSVLVGSLENGRLERKNRARMCNSLKEPAQRYAKKRSYERIAFCRFEHAEKRFLSR